MGNIYRIVKLCGLTTAGKKLGCTEANALVDTGSTRTLISTRIAKQLRSKSLKGIPTFVEGRRIPVALAGIELDAPRCTIEASVVAIDDQLITRAGLDDMGRPVEVILGHDYLQKQNASIQFDSGKD